MAAKHTRCALLAQAAQPFAARVEHRGIGHDSQVIDSRQYHHLRLGIEPFHQWPVCIGVILLVIGADQDEHVIAERSDVALISEAGCIEVFSRYE